MNQNKENRHTSEELKVLFGQPTREHPDPIGAVIYTTLFVIVLVCILALISPEALGLIAAGAVSAILFFIAMGVLGAWD